MGISDVREGVEAFMDDFVTISVFANGTSDEMLGLHCMLYDLWSVLYLSKWYECSYTVHFSLRACPYNELMQLEHESHQCYFEFSKKFSTHAMRVLSRIRDTPPAQMLLSHVYAWA